MKIVSIGNSFSEDAQAYLHALAVQRGIDLTTVNLAIGGCSLQTHHGNVTHNNANYLYGINGGAWAENLVTIKEILETEQFDAVTLQQVSGLSGQYETYQPYLNELAAYVKALQPGADLYFHRTWAYEWGSPHGDFPRYDCDQDKMYAAICEASASACLVTGAALIPAGDVVQTLRRTVPAFDYKNGGESLCRDSFHMSLTYGRFAVALTWLATLSGKPVQPMPFMDLDEGLIAEICRVVNAVIFEP